MPRIAIYKLRFTEAKALKFTCPPGKKAELYRDTEVPGFRVRVTPNGVRSYIFERRVHGRCMRTTIGDVRTWALGEARAEARRLGVLIDQGQDPRIEAREREAAGRARIALERRSCVTLANR